MNMPTNEKDDDQKKPPASTTKDCAIKAEQGKKRKPKQRRKPKSMPRRPLSAYNFFFKEQRALIVAEKQQNPETAQEKQPNLFSTMGKEIARRWQALAQPEREKYAKQAEGDMQRYRREMEDYHADVARKTRLDSEKIDLRCASAQGGESYAGGVASLDDSLHQGRGVGGLTRMAEAAATAHARLPDTGQATLSSLLANASHYPQPPHMSGSQSGELANASLTDAQILQFLLAQQQFGQSGPSGSGRGQLFGTPASRTNSGTNPLYPPSLLEQSLLEQQRELALLGGQSMFGQAERNGQQGSMTSHNLFSIELQRLQQQQQQQQQVAASLPSYPGVMLQNQGRPSTSTEGSFDRILQQLASLSPGDLQALASVVKHPSEARPDDRRPDLRDD